MKSNTWVLAFVAGLAMFASMALGARLSTGAWPEVKALMANWQVGSAGQAKSNAPGPAAKTIIYYRNPMGAPDTSPVPKKDSMGMDYIPVYDEEAASSQDDAKTVRVSLDKVQRSGVRTAVASLRKLSLPIRAPGKVTIDDRTLRMITLRVDGYVDKLYVNAIGQQVKQGEPLFRLFSQEVQNAEALYQATMYAAGAKSGIGVDGALRRLTDDRPVG